MELLAAQARECEPDVVAIGRAELRDELRAAVGSGIEVLAGVEAYGELATRADVVVNGVVGFAGLGVTLAALGAGKRLALANKESLIAAGPVVQQGGSYVPPPAMDAARRRPGPTCRPGNGGGRS